MPRTFSPVDSALIADLHALSKMAPKLVKSSTYPAPALPDVRVCSWKMNKFKYYDVPSPFPTLARGLFTVELPEEDGRGDAEQRYRIVVRGYDKFFNIGEVPWTIWPALEAHTSAPYTLSLKSNGCIIFIAALSPEKLLVTSKHSLGPGLDALPDAPDLSPDPDSGPKPAHAQAGERWLRRYLAQKGRTEADMARTLWENNWTAVAELCDDSFEEHVLPYPPALTGLHLHGLNACTKAFHTLSATTVEAFAQEWGFIQTRTITFDTIREVRDFTDRVGREGQWDGEAVEGFVVRTHVCEPVVEAEGGGGKAVKGRSPYEVRSTFFFKIKFDEPYMMYRDWREITKVLLSGYAKTRKMPSLDTLPKNKMKRPDTRLYARWVSSDIVRNPEAFVGYQHGRGIIAARERYFAWLERQGKGIGELLQEKGLPGLADREGSGNGKDSGRETAKEEKWDKTIIVPIGIPGCGKTAVSLALSRLFGFAHTQSDGVQARKAGSVFVKNVMKLLETNGVVIADKNNHRKQHRLALRYSSTPNSKSRLRSQSKFTPVRTRLLALNWDLPSPARTHEICAFRVLARGANHQTLPADLQGGKHEEVLWMFLTTWEELADAEVDAVVTMELEEGLEEAVRRAVDGVVHVLGVERPSEERMREVIEAVKAYEVEEERRRNGPGGGDQGQGQGQQQGEVKIAKKPRTPRYFALLPQVDLIPLLDSRLSQQDVSPEVKSFWEQLNQAKRVAARPHVTIVHERVKKEESTVWAACEMLLTSLQPPVLQSTLGHVLCDGRVMALTVEQLGVAEGSVDARNTFLASLPTEVKDRLHITVGTRDKNVKAVEAMALVASWSAYEG